MDVILIPGFWLNAASWDPITRTLQEAGHAAHPLTLPGLESGDAHRSGVGLRDHVDAVAAVVDRLPGDVVLVGHSGGGAIAHAVADARPDRIARVIYVDSGPLAAGDCINDGLPITDGEIPLPDWGVFDESSMVDMDDAVRERFRHDAIPQPARVATDAQELHGPRRYDVPVTVICCEFRAAQVREWLDADAPFVAELKAIKDVTLVDLPTGHWPQFTKPDELAAIILEALEA